MVIGISIAGLALIAAGVLYFVLLPHVEGPSIDKQRADRRQILVCCPDCKTWQTTEPIASTANDLDLKFQNKETNWFRCQQCDHRWSEERSQ